MITTNKVYFIRHAPTEANMSGTMVKDYDSYDIIRPLDDRLWWDKVGSNIRVVHSHNYSDAFHFWMLTSPATRCISTARYLFPHPSKADHEWLSKSEGLKELDCSGLGDLKFWEVSREEFDSKVHPDLNAFDNQVTKEINDIIYDCICFNHDMICITHGLYIRYLYNKLTNLGDDNLYDLINSKTFQFYNLDMMECSISDGKMKVDNIYRFKD